MQNNVCKVIVVLIIIVVIITISTVMKQQEQEEYDLVRIHIRANSNSREDQALKLQVKNRLIDILTPLMANAENKDDALNILKMNRKYIQKESNNILAINKVEYQSKVSLLREEFPTKVYGDLIFEKGYYDALIIDLGLASGDNWWCVAFPPLCFVPTDDGNIRYKSKIMELINNRK